MATGALRPGETLIGLIKDYVITNMVGCIWEGVDVRGNHTEINEDNI